MAARGGVSCLFLLTEKGFFLFFVFLSVTFRLSDLR